jgi:hypothetical protein
MKRFHLKNCFYRSDRILDKKKFSGLFSDFIFIDILRISINVYAAKQGKAKLCSPLKHLLNTNQTDTIKWGVFFVPKNEVFRKSFK